MNEPTAARAIRIRDVGKTFGSGDSAVTALNHISVDIEPGQFLSVVGPSGCGKSTLLRIVAGLLAPTSGGVEIGGVAVTKPYTDIGIVFQRDLLLESRTALGNVLLQLEMRGLPIEPVRARALELLDRVGLAGFAGMYPRELSGGMRQRVAICRALIHDPPILLMDEPFGALDALTREEIALDLMRLCEGGGKTVLFITHSINEAVFLSDRVIVMTSRPALIARDLMVDLERPRTLQQESGAAFSGYVNEIRSLLIGKAATHL
jgi:NitT/TauT family transport system ATP-binding protein